MLSSAGEGFKVLMGSEWIRALGQQKEQKQTENLLPRLYAGFNSCNTAGMQLGGSVSRVTRMIDAG